MAIHGPIRVNATTIGSWYARNTGVVDDGGNHVYDCEVDLNGNRHTFTVHHLRTDSATKLIAKVMNAALL